MNPKSLFFLFIILGTLFEVVADIFLKKWAIESRHIFIIIGIFFYTIGTIFWAYSLKFEFLSKAAIIFNLANLILAVVAGLFLFNEDLSFPNKVGVILGLLSIFLLES